MSFMKRWIAASIRQQMCTEDPLEQKRKGFLGALEHTTYDQAQQTSITALRHPITIAAKGARLQSDNALGFT